MTETTPEQLARTSVEAFNQSDWDGLRATLAADFVYEETGTGRRLVGADETVAALQAWKSALPDATGEILRVISDADTAVAEIVWRGTQTGSLDTGSAVLPPTGRAIEMSATMWLQAGGGLLLAERHHLDVLTMLAQLGALPIPA